MNFMKISVLLSTSMLMFNVTQAHYPYVAPLSYQTFNNHTAILSGFYDNPFASEVAIKNFKFHYHNPLGEKIEIADEQWSKTQTLASLSLENKLDGTYRIRGVKQGSTTKFAFDMGAWKTLIGGQLSTGKPVLEKVVYVSQLNKNSQIKEMQTVEIVETFLSRNNINNKVIDHVHDGFDIQFFSHPNALKANKSIHLKMLDQHKGIADLDVEILAQTTNFSRDTKAYQRFKTDAQGNLNFKIKDKGQYLLKVDYQQPFESKEKSLKRYKYTLSFNVI